MFEGDLGDPMVPFKAKCAWRSLSLFLFNRIDEAKLVKIPLLSQAGDNLRSSKKTTQRLAVSPEIRTLAPPSRSPRK